MNKKGQARIQWADEIDQADGSPDELEELIAEMTAKDSNFPRLLEEAIERQTLMHTLIQERKRQRVTQKDLAARMGTKQSTLARLEQEQRDRRLSTLQRYASSLGKRITWQLVDAYTKLRSKMQCGPGADARSAATARRVEFARVNATWY